MPESGSSVSTLKLKFDEPLVIIGNGSFIAFWIYGAVEPTTGEQFLLQFTGNVLDLWK